jgi:hypothetical protein
MYVCMLPYVHVCVYACIVGGVLCVSGWLEWTLLVETDISSASTHTHTLSLSLSQPFAIGKARHCFEVVHVNAGTQKKVLLESESKAAKEMLIAQLQDVIDALLRK